MRQVLASVLAQLRDIETDVSNALETSRPPRGGPPMPSTPDPDEWADYFRALAAGPSHFRAAVGTLIAQVSARQFAAAEAAAEARRPLPCPGMAYGRQCGNPLLAGEVTYCSECKGRGSAMGATAETGWQCEAVTMGVRCLRRLHNGKKICSYHHDRMSHTGGT